MYKSLAIGSLSVGFLLVAVVTGQARQISVWGNNFSVDDGVAAVQPAPIGPRFNATVAHPERLMRRHKILENLN